MMNDDRETPEEYAARHDRYGNPMRPPLSREERVVIRAHDMLRESGAVRDRAPRGLAMPFGVSEPDAWRWRVSIDIQQYIWRRMVDLAGPSAIVDPPVADRLFGIALMVDGTLPPGSLRLEMASSGTVVAR